MKTFTYIAVVVLFVVGIFWFMNQSRTEAPVETPVTPIEQSEQTEQTDTGEEEKVAQYIRANIRTLAPAAPVLGGNWYVVSVTVDKENHLGSVVYEDGHMQEDRKFSYTMTPEGEVLSVEME